MITDGLFLLLSRQQTKQDYLKTVESQLDWCVSELSRLGYKVDKKTGLIGEQAFNNRSALEVYSLLRDMHYVFWGLTTNNWIYDQVDKTYYIGLRGFVESQYNSLS